MELLNTLAKEYALSLAAYHFLMNSAPFAVTSAAYGNMCDAQNRLNDAAKALAESNEYTSVVV